MSIEENDIPLMETSSIPSTSSASAVSRSSSNCSSSSSSIILDGTFFKIDHEKSSDNTIVAICVRCEPKRVEIRGRMSSTSNFCSHLKRRHGVAVFNEYKQYLESTKLRSRETFTSTGVMQRRRIARNREISQESFDSCITNYVLHSLVPLRIVDDPYFREIFDYLHIADHGISVMSRRNLCRRIHNLFSSNVADIKHNLNNIQFVCTTADIWSAKRRSFLGVTAHWIEPQSFQRKSVALACRKFPGTHSYDRIAQLLQDIHKEYNLNYPKLIATITDNGSNFVKAFRVFGVQISYTNDEDESDSSNTEEECDESTISNNSDENLRDAISTVLPRHIRCFAHTLSLCSTSNVMRTIKGSEDLNNLHTQTMHRCTQLWNATSRPKSAEIVQNILGHTLSRPGDTRWNSLHDSLSQILTIKDKNNLLCRSLGIKEILTEQNFLYIEEYVAATNPITHALDILQGEKNVFYGMVIPCLLSLQKKLDTLSAREWVYCKSVVQCLQNSIETRFHIYLNFTSQESKDAIIAAFSHPFFKHRWLSWVPLAKHDRLISIFKSALMTQMTAERLNPISSNNSELLKLSSFFDFHTPPTSVNQSLENNSKIDLLTSQYFADKNNEYSCLNTYTEIRNIFLQYNTPLPSSAPVERLFSFATMSNSPKSNRLSDQLFEQRVVLKANLLNKLE